jgi:hypothetical protein
MAPNRMINDHSQPDTPEELAWILPTATVRCDCSTYTISARHPRGGCPKCFGPLEMIEVHDE